MQLYSTGRKRCRPILPIGSGAALFCQSEALPLYPANRKRCRSIYWLEAMLLYTYGRQRSRSILPFGVDASLFHLGRESSTEAFADRLRPHSIPHGRGVIPHERGIENSVHPIRPKTCGKTDSKSARGRRIEHFSSGNWIEVFEMKRQKGD